MRAEIKPAVQSELDAALTAEIRKHDLIWAKGSALLWLVIAMLAFVVGPFVRARFGAMIGAVSVALLIYFIFVIRLLSRPEPPEWVSPLNSFAMAAAPWIFLVSTALTEGASYALASWVPPFIFLAVMNGAVVRLRPSSPIIIGFSSAAIYTLLYFFMLHPMLEREGPIALVNQPTFQIGRVGLLLIAGVAIGLVTWQLRKLVGRATSAVREKDLFGKYRLVGTIASGGMGEILEAVYCPEGGFERRVAIKRVHEHLATQQPFVDAFRGEAEICSRLAHPNVVQVMDFGKIGATYFLAMEYVDGVTLQALAKAAEQRGEALPTDLVAFLGAEVLAGLAHAHEGVFGDDGRPLRIVHRDVCPQNVLLSKNGEVKVADFGIARVLGDAVSTQTRTIAGHVGYFAPEQASGKPIDPRADLFAVGVMLWELLAGRRLFKGPNEIAIMMAVVNQEVPRISTVRTWLDPAWDAFFARALERDPVGRFASARAMAEALADLPGAAGHDPVAKLAALVESTRAKPTAADMDAMTTRQMKGGVADKTVVDHVTAERRAT